MAAKQILKLFSKLPDLCFRRLPFTGSSGGSGHGRAAPGRNRWLRLFGSRLNPQIIIYLYNPVPSLLADDPISGQAKLPLESHYCIAGSTAKNPVCGHTGNIRIGIGNIIKISLHFQYTVAGGSYLQQRTGEFI